MNLTDKTAIVTGGGRGIGRAICLALARHGCKIVIAARTKFEIEDTKKEVEKLGARAITIQTDIRKEKDVKNLIAKAMKTFGKIDILVNNAGVALRKPLVDTSLGEYDKIMDTNTKGMFLCIKYSLPQMKYGKIINISSGAGKSGIPGLSVYCASKFAVIGLTESLAGETKKVKVYAVCPGGVNTKMSRSLFNTIPSLEPEDIANKIIDICQDDTLPSGTSMEVYG